MSKKIVTGITVAVVILLIGCMAWLFLSGQVRVLWGKSNESVVVCGTGVVDTYNAAMHYQTRTGSSGPALDEEGLKKLAVDIKSKPGYESDPTCQSMLFWMAIHDRNYTAATSAYDAVKKLHDKRIFADSNIRDNGPSYTYDSVLQGISSPAGNQDGAGGI